MPLLVSLGEARSGGDEDPLRLSGGGRRWCLWLSPSGADAPIGPLTLSWGCQLLVRFPSIILGPLLKSLKTEEPS